MGKTRAIGSLRSRGKRQSTPRYACNRNGQGSIFFVGDSLPPMSAISAFFRPRYFFSRFFKHVLMGDWLGEVSHTDAFQLTRYRRSFVRCVLQRVRRPVIVKYMSHMGRSPATGF